MAGEQSLAILSIGEISRPFTPGFMSGPVDVMEGGRAEQVRRLVSGKRGDPRDGGEATGDARITKRPDSWLRAEPFQPESRRNWEVLEASTETESELDSAYDEHSSEPVDD